MRIYFDSNIFRKIRKDSRVFELNLYETVERLRKAFVFIFSDAHLSDLSNSDPSYREKDLKHMEEYVGNNFFSFDHVHKKFHVYLATPQQAYAAQDFHTYQHALENPIKAIEELFNEDEAQILKPFMNMLLDLPITKNLYSGEEFSALMTPEVTEAMTKIHTLRDALDGASGVSGMLTNKNEFSAMQSMMLSYINRRDYSFDAWSFDFDQRMKTTAFGKTFTEMVDMTCAGLPKDDTYNRFINFYTYLEYLGVTEERVGGKRKKNSMLDLQKDAAHAYFASNTDYFVSDDRGVLSKAFITYKMFGIQTEVLSVADFITKSGFLLKNEEDLSSFGKGIKFSINNGFVMEHSALTGSQLIKLSYPVLNYFDRLQFSNLPNDSSILLFRSPRTSHGMMWAEFDLLLSKCIQLFGVPSDRKERLDINSYNNKDNARDRRWNIGKSEIILDFGQTSNNESVILLQILFER